jgi:hypothetical protein
MFESGGWLLSVVGGVEYVLAIVGVVVLCLAVKIVVDEGIVTDLRERRVIRNRLRPLAVESVSVLRGDHHRQGSLPRACPRVLGDPTDDGGLAISVVNVGREIACNVKVWLPPDGAVTPRTNWKATLYKERYLYPWSPELAFVLQGELAEPRPILVYWADRQGDAFSMRELPNS